MRTQLLDILSSKQSLGKYQTYSIERGSGITCIYQRQFTGGNTFWFRTHFDGLKDKYLQASYDFEKNDCNNEYWSTILEVFLLDGFLPVRINNDKKNRLFPVQRLFKLIHLLRGFLVSRESQGDILLYWQIRPVSLVAFLIEGFLL